MEGTQGGTSKDAFSMKSMDFGTLEKELEDSCAMPMALPLDFLKSITRNFSEEQELGRGGFGVVYKGFLQNGKTIAVKKLDVLLDKDNIQLYNEITSLMRLMKHENIVQLIGYCIESRKEIFEINKHNHVIAEKRHMLICFEYLSNKDLGSYISGTAEYSGLEWHIIYEIIRGICRGLHYLHEECQIVHLDLKPQNILMGDNMVPKIADFGMSRLFGDQQALVITQSRRQGTLGYMAPEYLEKGGYPQNSEASFGHFIQNVVQKWRNRLEKTPKYIALLETYSQQVKACIEIGLRCVDSDLSKRPNAWDIIKKLNAIEGKDMYSGVNEGQLMDEAGWSRFTNAKEKVPQPLIVLAGHESPATGHLSYSTDVSFSYGGASSAGKRASVEDIYEDFYEARIDDIAGEKVGMFGVYDCLVAPKGVCWGSDLNDQNSANFAHLGHGGESTAEYVKQHLLSNLIKHPKFITDTKAAIAETYNRTDSECLKADSSQNADAGSTALTAIIIGDRLIVANVGDSRAVICKGGQAIAVTRDHKPDQSDERQRIEDAGGFVMWNGTWRVCGVLTASRAFGCPSSLKQYIVADPEIKEEVVDSSLEFLILASRGLWDVVTTEEAVAIAKPIIRDPEEAAKELLREANKRGSSDSTTVVIVRFL